MQCIHGTFHISNWILTPWGPRCIWGPWDVLTCTDICAFFQLFINMLMAKV